MSWKGVQNKRFKFKEMLKSKQLKIRDRFTQTLVPTSFIKSAI